MSGSAECSFWDQSLDDGYGAWSTEGCSLVKDGRDSTSCKCNHLTNFAILVDPAGLTQDQHIGAAIIIGPIILLICAIFTFICVTITR